MDLNKFKFWLESHGAQILPVTNSYELLRFKAKEVGVLYTTGKSSGIYMDEAINAFKTGKKWKGKPVIMKRKSYKKHKEKLLIRDGSKCFMCLEELKDDITLEHLIPLSKGGKNEFYNMVLCHEKCNVELGNKPLNEKIELVIATRMVKKIKNNEKKT